MAMGPPKLLTLSKGGTVSGVLDVTARDCVNLCDYDEIKDNMILSVMSYN